MAEWKKVVVSGSSAVLAGLTVDATISGDIGGNAATVTTNAALTGDVTSDGSSNATTIANDAVTTAKILDANVTNAKLLHDGLMIGSTDISLGATGSSLAGLTDVTATGRVAAANIGSSDGTSTLTGSFAGDGSALTGLPDATDAKFLVYTTGSGTDSRQSVGSGNASGNGSVVSGGKTNTALGNCSTVAGGKGNCIGTNACHSTVGGGTNNKVIDGNSNTIGGGCGNFVWNGEMNTVSGGYNNTICNNVYYSNLAGGYNNKVTGNYATIAGGINNCVSATNAGVLSGDTNINAGQKSVIAGGCTNSITSAGSNGGILGGVNNTVNSSKSFIVGSGISTTVANHTHVSNLTTAGSITGSNICGTGRVQGATMGDVDGSSTITGSFVGDGSSLTGLPAAAIETYTGGTSGRIITAVDGTSVEGEANLTFDGSTLAVTGNATISQDLTIARNLIVQGTASFESTENLLIKDRFIGLASGSAGASDGGIVVEQSNVGGGKGAVFAFDGLSTGRWGVDLDFNPTASAYTPAAFMSNVVIGGGASPAASAPATAYVKAGNIYAATDESLWIYSA